MNTSDEKPLVKKCDPNVAMQIERECSLRPLTARLLSAKGIESPEEASRFLTPSLDRDWHDPALIPGLIEVADRVEATVRASGRILIFGDFDVDGITATTIMVRALRALGCDTHGIIPRRFDEGYALSEAAVKRGMEYSPDLIVTVDCGISCGKEVAALLAAGVDVVVTDHHEPGENVPVGIPMADPKLDENCPSFDLAGAGVALKLIDVLGKRFDQPELWREFTDYAAFGTTADLMPLKDENRALVADGIARCNINPRPSMSALAAVCGKDMKTIKSENLSFSLIPRLNAAGRMGDAAVAYDLLMSDNLEEAEVLAARLDEVNETRRTIERELAETVEQRLQTEFHGESAIVIAGEGWHEGVKGIVASRIAREYKRPTLIFALQDGDAQGSGRTYGSINLFELLSEHKDMFKKFGGHAAAVGLTLSADKLDEFRDLLCAQIDKLLPLPPLPEADVSVKLSECDAEGLREIDYLEPFGNGNEIPSFVAENVFLQDTRAVGKEASHLSFKAGDGSSTMAGIYFSCPDIEQMCNCVSACDIVFKPTLEEFRGRFTPKMMTKRIFVHRPPEVKYESTFIDELFENADRYTEKGDYAGITQADSFNTKIVGVTFENRQEILENLEAGVELALKRQPENEFDSNAIAVTLLDGAQLGYLNRFLAEKLALVMDSGIEYDAAVSAITGGPGSGADEVRVPGPLGVRDPGVVNRSYGVNIVVRRVGADPASDQPLVLDLAAEKGKWGSIPADSLDDALKRELIGDHELHAAQKDTLDALAAGQSVLTVMATGRGKSLIFHLHAARIALRDNKASVFIYPLRALVADQVYHLTDVYSRFGLSVEVLTGESEPDERERIYDGLRSGSVDVVLTTPEFLSIHADRFEQTGRIGFLVVDEAHHVGQAKAGNRPAYAALDKTITALGSPQVLAVTATAGNDVATSIKERLGIEKTILDPTVRDNLRISDHRDLRDRAGYIAARALEGGKLVAYVNSRDQSVELARELRKRLPELAGRISFYNAGLSRSDRKRIEAAFRSGELQLVVSTSAFGEGIDIPDIEHVVLYHLPFDEVEFNQMSGRAGRNGEEATVHLLYGYGDARINESILESSAPKRDTMALLYKALRAESAQLADAEGGFSITNGELVKWIKDHAKGTRVTESSVSTGVSVFRELGFLQTSGHSVARRITMVEAPSRMELTESVRYREGQEECRDFAEFKTWALGASAEDLLSRFNRPILPNA